MPETDLIIHCNQCGFINMKVHMDGLFIDEDCRDFARKVITEEHAASHQQPQWDGKMKCTYCDQRFLSHTEWDHHIETVHNS